MICGTVYGQKYCDVTIHFPDTAYYNRIEFQYDDGLQQLRVDPVVGNAHSFLIKKKYYSRYATIIIVLHKLDGSVLSYNYFWVTNTPATITFKNKLIDSTSLNYPSIEHAYELKDKKIVKEITTFCSAQQHDYDSLYLKYRNTEFQDSVIGIEFGRANLALHDKQMDFIESHGSSYYCFWLFQRETRYGFFSADTLLKIFETIFSPAFQLSIEGQRIKKLLTDKIQVNKKYAFDFISKDINGNVVALKNFRGKYVLLNFWATWCGPCLAEMPDIEKIRKTFPKSELAIISICLRSDTAGFRKDIKKFNMNWTNIFDDENIINGYSVRSIPQIYLIDKEGRIIYKEHDLEPKSIDKGLNKLWKILYSMTTLIH